MAYVALGLAILGLSAGLTSRLKVLLLLVCVVFPLSIGFCVWGGFTLLGSVAIVAIAQTILQCCYLLGAAIHTFLSASEVAQSEDEASDPTGSASVDAFDRRRTTRRLLRPFAQGIVRSQFSSRQR